MSIYSGFATRFQQQAYDHCIDSLLYVLQKRIIKFYTNESSDEEKFISLVVKLNHQLRNMEKSKYLDPKSSTSVHQLVKFLTINAESIERNQRIEPQTVEEPVQVNQPEIVSNQKKKNTLWVEKKVEENQLSKQSLLPVQVSPSARMEAQVQTIDPRGNCEYHNSSRRNFHKLDTGIRPRKTSYNFHLKAKVSSRKNLSKQHITRQRSGGNSIQQANNIPVGAMRPLKVTKNRSMSHNMVEHPSISSNKVSFNLMPQQNGYNQMISVQQQNKLAAHNKMNYAQSDTHSNQAHHQVSDIIKDYIIKSKKNHMRGNGRRSSNHHFQE